MGEEIHSKQAAMYPMECGLASAHKAKETSVPVFQLVSVSPDTMRYNSNIDPICSQLGSLKKSNFHPNPQHTHSLKEITQEFSMK